MKLIQNIVDTIRGNRERKNSKWKVENGNTQKHYKNSLWSTNRKEK